MYGTDVFSLVINCFCFGDLGKLPKKLSPAIIFTVPVKVEWRDGTSLRTAGVYEFLSDNDCSVHEVKLVYKFVIVFSRSLKNEPLSEMKPK